MDLYEVTKEIQLGSVAPELNWIWVCYFLCFSCEVLYSLRIMERREGREMGENWAARDLLISRDFFT